MLVGARMCPQICLRWEFSESLLNERSPRRRCKPRAADEKQLQAATEKDVTAVLSHLPPQHSKTRFLARIRRQEGLREPSPALIL